MVQAGLSPLESLRATTSEGAALLGVDDDRGRIAPGQRADLVLLDGAPGEVDALAARVRGVYLDGRQVSTGPASAR